MTTGTTRGKLILVGGGARSGKSAFAQAYAERLGTRRVFVATGQAFDAEMAARIAQHQRDRGSAFRTVEAPVAVADALRAAADAQVVLVDCLTLWLSNLLLRGDDPTAIEREIEALAGAATGAIRGRHVVLVTNEVGMGLVPETPLGRQFRDLAGRAHQRIARLADEIYLAAMGVVVRLSPDPLRTFRPGEIP
jgi:adenosylcobinamide kinase/adenosylcobinamide-phosphate guanylyltransferase